MSASRAMFSLRLANATRTFAAFTTLSLGLAACAPMQTAPASTVPTSTVPPTNAPITAAVATTSIAVPAGPPRSLLYVGNSFMYYNNSLHGHVGLLARASNQKEQAAHRAVSVTISGSGIDWHDMASYFRPNAMARYSFVGDNEVRFNPAGRMFDGVLMMDCSQCPVHPQLRPIFFEFAKKHSDTVRANGAQPMFFMTWAYADKPEMTQSLAAAYTEAGRQNNAKVVPAGLAFARSIALKPDLNLYIADKRHPSLAGTYLAAAVVLASIYQVSPVGNSYTAGLDAATARHLQEVAWDTVQGYKQ